ncbi:MAG: serine/threonine protein kinase [Planctomycetota bacterium]|nr:MAG: serine/threonine protein kinase [Planctomycetota bacterium]
MTSRPRLSPRCALRSLGALAVAGVLAVAPALAEDGDWNQWGGSASRNNAPESGPLPIDWDPGQFDAETGAWKPETSRNIAWVAQLGSQSYGNPVVAGGKAYVGTNNGKGWIGRYPSSVDLGCLLAFNTNDGSFLWQDSSEKLPTGRVHDWPLQGICCSPYVEGDRLWYVTSRGEVKCLDTEGFRDGENDGPFTGEKMQGSDESDTVWVLDMMKELGVSQHNMCSCSVTAVGDLLFVNTSNGVDEGHLNLPNAAAPSFLCVDKRDGKVLWADGSPGANVLHGQWSSPSYAVIDDVPQVIFGGGDGWVYGFDARGDNGKAKLLWQFDANPKESKYVLGGRADRNHIIGTPVIHDGLVYVAVGEDPEHGEGVGHLWCIDPTKRGDVSPELAVNVADPTKSLPHRRNQAVIKEQGEVARPNPNSAAVWHYPGFDANGNGKLDFDETMHRTCGTVAIKDGLLVIPDFSGLVHCVDVKTGKPHWTHDMLAASWGSPMMGDGKIYVGDEDGDISIFELSPEKNLIAEVNMGNSVYSTPIVAGGTLYIANKSHLFAIREGATPEAK